jgi:hypothetical protein
VEARGSMGAKCRVADRGGAGVRGIDGALRSRARQQLREESESVVAMERREVEAGAATATAEERVMAAFW